MAIGQSHKKWILWAVVIAVSFSLGFLVRQPAGASTSEPGSSADPIAAKSYVDQMATYKIVDLVAGEKLISTADGTEFVVRAGAVVAYNVAPNAGLANLTTGKSISSAVEIPRDNYILIPRKDRGLKATTNNTVVLVKGNYRIEN